MDKDGISRWRQIGEILIGEIERGELPADRKLPPSSDLATRFGVNRHTVLRALAHLQAGGFVRMERGRGTYAVVNPLQLRLGAQRWFEQNLAQGNRAPSRRVMAVAVLPATQVVAEALQVDAGDDVAFVTLLGEGDGVPVNLVSNYFPLERLPGIDGAFRAYGREPTTELSFGKVFKSLGVSDFRRKSVRIRSRRPSADEARHLQIAPTDHVLETDVVLVDPSETPLSYAHTCYPSSRVEFVLDL
jgi:GntR family phosphonate transport system transcriptional regulator